MPFGIIRRASESPQTNRGLRAFFYPLLCSEAGDAAKLNLKQIFNYAKLLNICGDSIILVSEAL